MGVERNYGRALGGQQRKTGAQAQDPRLFRAGASVGRHLTLENADACLKISSAESASSSPRS